MNQKQLDFVMDKLNITATNRRMGLSNIIINGDSAYSVEIFHALAKNTANRDAIRCSEKWAELLNDCVIVKELVETSSIVSAES